MNNSYKTEYFIKYSETDGSYRMRPDYIVSHFQDITGEHSFEMGIDGPTMKEKSNAFWVVTKMKLKFLELPQFGDTVELETWPTFFDRVRFGRDYRICQNGKVAVMGTSEWCTIDLDSRMIRRTESVCYPHDMVHREDRSGAGTFIRIKETVSEEDFCYRHKVLFVDIDTNGHTNNVAYLRMMLNTFAPEEFSKLNIDEMQVNFVSQSFYNDEIAVYKKRTDYGYYVEGKKDNLTVFTTHIVEKK